MVTGGCSALPRLLPQKFHGELDSELAGGKLPLAPSQAPGPSVLKEEYAAGDEQEESSKPRSQVSHGALQKVETLRGNLPSYTGENNVEPDYWHYHATPCQASVEGFVRQSVSIIRTSEPDRVPALPHVGDQRQCYHEVDDDVEQKR